MTTREQAPSLHTFANGDVEFSKGDNWTNWSTSGHAVRRCDATTGHSVRDVAFCDTASRAVGIVTAIADRDELLVALRECATYIISPLRMTGDVDEAARRSALFERASAVIAKAEGRTP